MNSLRYFYRNVLIETILLFAVGIQIYSGIKLFRVNRTQSKSFFEKLHLWSGLYLAAFFVIHLGAVFAGRFVLKLDTNFYFGAAGLNSFPFNLFFIPYYGLAIIAFFGHIASIHNKKMKWNVFRLSPLSQAKIILGLGICIMIFTLYGLTNRFKGVEIPAEYNVLIGK